MNWAALAITLLVLLLVWHAWAARSWALRAEECRQAAERNGQAACGAAFDTGQLAAELDEIYEVLDQEANSYTERR